MARACTHKSRTLTDLAMSALPLEADIRASFRHVCLGPEADIAAYATSAKYVRAVDLSRADKAAK